MRHGDKGGQGTDHRSVVLGVLASPHPARTCLCVQVFPVFCARCQKPERALHIQLFSAGVVLIGSCFKLNRMLFGKRIDSFKKGTATVGYCYQQSNNRTLGSA